MLSIRSCIGMATLVLCFAGLVFCESVVAQSSDSPSLAKPAKNAVSPTLEATRDERSFDAARRVLERSCIECHHSQNPMGGLSMETEQLFRTGGESGPLVATDGSQPSLLLDMIRPQNGHAKMPKDRPALPEADRELLQRWVEAGSPWPDHIVLREWTEAEKAREWWSYQPLQPIAPPVEAMNLVDSAGPWGLNAVDVFIAEKHQEKGLKPAPPASKRQLLRRLSYDLLGLPPTPDQVAAFERDSRPDAYERLVDEMLASPAYGERWARHWMDIVHYADTHGYDKDKPRPNAWPYRDYCIRAFNQDKAYEQFILEQLAGDTLDDPVIESLGFLAAGPWDFIGHAEVAETKIDGKIARHLDRDDMVQNTMLTFQSTTVGCAQCHQHKFDPISQEEYYSLQAVFAAIDRTDVEYYTDPETQRTWSRLQSERGRLEKRHTEVEESIKTIGGEVLASFDRQIQLAKQPSQKYPEEHGYHSELAQRPDEVKWVQVDLGKVYSLAELQWVGCYDDFNQIGEGFGYPLSMTIAFSETLEAMANSQPYQTLSVTESPGCAWQSLAVPDVKARYVRLTAQRLAERKGDYIFALAELRVLDASGANLAPSGEVTSLDSIEAPIRWGRKNLVDGIFPNPQKALQPLEKLLTERKEWLAKNVDAKLLSDEDRLETDLEENRKQLAELPTPQRVYAGSIHKGSGAFVGRGAMGGEPRPIFVLARGDVTQPQKQVQPGSLQCFENLPHFEPPTQPQPESYYRAKLARWIIDPNNPLTWRTMVNRLWQYHFSTGIVATANDFGRMGSLPTHPALLDYLAAQLREHQSLKEIQRLLVTSATYRQASQGVSLPSLQNSVVTNSSVAPEAIDPGNLFLWRMNRRRLEAEAIRDTLLMASNHLDRRMGGPGFQDFVIQQPDHSPHYEYHLHDQDDTSALRRTVYRMIVRSQTQPFLTCLDCADPSLQVDRRNESNSPVQALAMLNDALTLKSAERLAERLRHDLPQATQSEQIAWGFQLLLGRAPEEDEGQSLTVYAREFGLENTCRILLTLNELIYVD